MGHAPGAVLKPSEGLPIRRPCPSYPGYSADSSGRIFSHRRRTPLSFRGGTTAVLDPLYARALRHCVKTNGYECVGILVGDRIRQVGVHRLVLDAFTGLCPPGMQCRHLDGNRRNNRPENLRWGTAVENMADRKAHGRYATGAAHPMAKLTSEQADYVRAMRKRGALIREISREFQLCESQVRLILKGTSYAA